MAVPFQLSLEDEGGLDRRRHDAVLGIRRQDLKRDHGVGHVLELCVFLLEVHPAQHAAAADRQGGHARLVRRHQVVVGDHAIDQRLGHDTKDDADQAQVQEIDRPG